LSGEIAPTEVKIVIVDEKPFEYFVQVAGRVQALEEAHLLIRASGLEKKIYVQNGDYVAKGKLIAELDNDQQRLGLEKADAILSEKRIEFEDKKLSYTLLGKDSLVKTKILENIKFTSGLVSAGLNYKQALLDFEKTKLTSPISGVVSALVSKENNPVAEGSLVAIVYNPKKLLVDCRISEGDALQIKRNFTADVRATGGKESFSALVYGIDPRVDEKTRLVNVTLQLRNTSRFIPGMSVQVTIKIPSQKSLLVPKEAVVVKSGKPVVFTAEEGLAKWNYISIGRENGKEIEVFSGLEKGKKVIVTNNLQLAHDAPVKVVN
jgi:RND family efflux transporter MFP subunit